MAISDHPQVVFQSAQRADMDQFSVSDNTLNTSYKQPEMDLALFALFSSIDTDLARIISTEEPT